MKLSDRANRLIGQGMFQVKQKAEALERKGKDMVHFEIGDVQFDTPEKVKEACIKAIEQNKTHYTSSYGLYELRKAISNEKNIPIEKILIAPANFCIFISLSLICNKGDEVVIRKPCFPTYLAVAKYLNLKIKDKITQKTKAVILNSPNNPTGSNQNEFIKEICEKLKKYDFWLIDDLAYANMKYTPLFIKKPIGHPKTIQIETFSKSHAMPAFRLGIMYAPKEIVDKGSLLIETTVSCFPDFIQWAGLEAIKIEKYKMKDLKKRKGLMYEGLKRLGYEIKKPEGGIYCWIKIKGKSEKFCDEMLKKGVVLCPGTIFGTEGYVRLCFANSIKNIKNGLERMKFLKIPKRY